MISSIGRALRRHRYEASIMQSLDDIFTATEQALKAKHKVLEQKKGMATGHKKQILYLTMISVSYMTPEFWELPPPPSPVAVKHGMN